MQKATILLVQEKLNEALSAIDRLSGGSKQENLQESSKWGTSQLVPEGSRLFQQGSRAREIYAIEKGLVKLIRHEADGKEIIAAIRYPGWLLGASSAILDEPFPMTAVTVTRSRLSRIAVEDFRSLIKRDAELSWRLHQMMAKELHNQVARLTGIECLTARQRLEEFLWQLVSSMEPAHDKAVRVQFPAKHFEIAQFLAVTPQYLSWMIGQLDKEQIIKRDKGWLVIPRPENLWHREGLQKPSLNLS